MKKQLLYFILLNVICISFWLLILPTLPEKLPLHSNVIKITTYATKETNALIICIIVASLTLLMYLISMWLLNFQKKLTLATKTQLIRCINILQLCGTCLFSMLPLLMMNLAPYSYAAYVFPLILLYQARFNPVLNVPVSGYSQVVSTEIVKYQLSETERKVYPLLSFFLIIYSAFTNDPTWMLIQLILLIILLNKMTFTLMNTIEQKKKQ